MATGYWKGANNGTWSVTTNWAANLDATGTISVVPGAGETAFFNANGTTTARDVYLNGSRSIGTLSFNSNNGGLGLRGGTSAVPATQTLTLGSGGIDMAASGGNINSYSSVTLSIANALTPLNVIGGRGAFIDGLISGTGGWSISGAGIAQFTNASSTYSGGTTVNAGTVQIGAGSTGSPTVTSGPFGTGTVTMTGGKLSSNSTTARTLANALSLNGTMTLGDATNTGDLTFSGTTTIAGPTTLTTASAVTFESTVSGGSSVTFTKAGSSTLTLVVANTFSGTTRVTLGTLTVFSVNGLQNSTVDWGTSTVGTLTLPASAVLGGLSTASGTANTFTRSSAYSVGNNNGNATFSGVLAGSGNITKVGTGAWTLDGASANTNTGTFTVSAGTVNANKATALGAANSTAAITVSSGATLSAGAALNYSLPGRSTTISGAGVSNAGALVINHAGAVHVGAITLGADTYIRGTQSGTLASSIANSSFIAELGAAAGTVFTLSGGLSGSGPVRIGFYSSDTGVVFLSTANVGLSGSTFISNYGTLRLGNPAALGSGILAFQGGAVDVSQTLEVTNTIAVFNNIVFAGTAQLTLSSAVALDASRTITTNGSGGALVLSNTVSGAGAKLTKAGTNTLKLNAANTYSGGTDINAGIIQAGNVQALGTTGTVTLGANGTLQTLTTGGQNGKLTVASLNNAAGGIIKIGG